MSLLSPWWLLSLIALPIMAALYFLKVRPRRQATNAFFLWEQIYQQNSSRALFKRLRDLWSLLLMLLVLALLAFAMAEPVIETDDSRDLIIVVDASASMQAQTGHGTRMELAQAEAERWIRNLDGQRQAAVASISDGLHFHSHLSRYPRELLDAVAAIQASDMPLSESAVQLLADLLAEDASYRILFITDHPSSRATLPAGLEYCVLELEPVSNAGIVAADVQWQPGRSDAATFYLRVLNRAASELSVDLELRHLETGVVAKLLPLTIAADASFETVFELAGVRPGMWQMSLLHSDALALDDTITLGLNPRRPITVRIESEHPWFYENCVRAFAQAGGVLQLSETTNASLQLVEGQGSSDAPTTLIFNPTGSSPFWESVGEPIAVELAEILTPSHHFLAHLDVPALRFAGARELVPAPGAVVLVAADDGTPLIYKITRAQRSALVVNLDPNAGNFFLSPWFPVMVHAAALHLSGREAAIAPVYTTGRNVEAPGTPTTSWTMSAPHDRTSIVTGGQSMRLPAAGTYHLNTDSLAWEFGGGLLNAEESSLTAAPRTEVQPRTGSVSLAHWLLIAAIFLLVVESLLYHRRLVG